MKNPRKDQLAERLEGLEQRLSRWLDDSHGRATELRDIVTGLKSGDWSAASPSDPAVSARETAALEELGSFARDVSGLPDQVAVLGRLLAGAAGLADRVVLFVVRDGALRGWSAAGLDPSVNARRLSFPLQGESILAKAVLCCDVTHAESGDPVGQEMVRALQGPAPAEMAAAPLWVRDRVAAVLYADVADQAGWLAGFLAAAATLASLTLEALPLRARHPRPAANGNVLTDCAPAPAVKALPAAAPAMPADDADKQREIEDARRFAHLLISEIVLYNEAEIAEGRRQKDLYPRLREDIDRSRRMFEQRFAQELPGAANYFHDELVSELAGGDASALNMQWP
ncbi:MAG: hypothetical protein ACREAA_09735 [Candidatus Polarisedimenticolia bacterium]